MTDAIQRIPPATLARRFAALWVGGGEPPDVFAFLAAHATASSDERFQVVLVDQNRRWRIRQPRPVAEYFERCPDMAESKYKLELLRDEFFHRKAADEPIDPTDFAAGFPDVQQQLLDTLLEADAAGLLRDEFLFADETSVEGRFPKVFEIARDTVAAPEIAPHAISPALPAAPPGYELLEVVGSGGMGVVYRAREIAFDRDVAVKFLQNHIAVDSPTARRFLDEARITAQLQHPAIPPVHHIGTLPDGRPFLAMKLIKGETLAELLRKKSPDVDAPGSPNLIQVFAQLCQGVAYAHSRKVIHRDLKPANVMVGAFGEVQVMDWGLAKILASREHERPKDDTVVDQLTEIRVLRDSDSATQSGSVMGTPAYMAPEQAAGEVDKVDERSDVFGLAAVLCAILTGEPPYLGRDVYAVGLKAMRGETADAFARLDSCAADPELVALCKRCLAVDRDSRPQNAGELAEAVTAHLAAAEERARLAELDRMRTEEQRKRRRMQLTLAAAVLGLAVAAGFGISGRITEQRNADTAESLVNSLLKADVTQVPAIVKEIDDYRRWANPLLKEKLAAAHDGSPEKLRLSLALLPVDRDQVAYLQTALLNADAPSLPVIRDALWPHRGVVAPALWKVLALKQEPAARRFNAACTLATYDGDNTESWKPMLPFVADQLVETLTRNPRDFSVVLKSLEPIRKRLAGPVAEIVRDAKRRELPRETALNVVLDYAADNPKQLAEVLADAEQRQFGKVFDRLAMHQAAAIPHLKAILTESWTEQTPEPEKERIAQRQADAAIALLKLGEPEPVWPLLRHTPDPRTRTYIIHRAAPLGVPPRLFLTRFDTEEEVTIRRALLLALGEFSAQQLSPAERNPFVKKLRTAYETDPDPGLHGCAEWLLRKWQRGKQIRDITQKLRTNEEQRSMTMKVGKRRWYVTTQGQTFAVLDAGVFRMGSPQSEPGRDNSETAHLKKIGRTFAIAAHEVTREQFARFQLEDRTIRRFNDGQYSRTPDSPQVNVDWYEAAAYCNWLSRKEGIPEIQWCYEKNAQGMYAAGMKPKENYLLLTGYRLPSDAEWEYACRAGATTSRYYGPTELLLPQYARYLANGENRAWPVGGLRPNDFGLFDMLGNAAEWCHDGLISYPIDDSKRLLQEKMDISTLSNRGIRVVRSGSFASHSAYVRSAYRYTLRPTNRFNVSGFRPSRTIR